MTNSQLRELRRRRVGPSGNRLVSAFDLDGRPQTQCARETGFSQQYISDVKAGRIQTVGVDNAHKFAAYFDCAIEDLFPARPARQAVA